MSDRFDDENDGGSEPVKLNKLNYLNLFGYIANIFVTYGVGVLGLGGAETNSALSEKYQSLVTPAGWAFSIWAVIFTFQGIFAIFQLLPGRRGTPMVQKGVRFYYGATCFAQILWTIFFTFELIWLSFLAMLLILLCLVALLVSQHKAESGSSSGAGILQYWFVRFPFQVHTGWIVAASVVNFNIVLVDAKSSAGTQLAFGALSLLSLLAVAALCLFSPKKSNVVIPAVLVWATAGVAQELNDPKQSIKSLFSEGQIRGVEIGAAVTSGIIALLSVGQIVCQCVRGRRAGGD